MSKIIYISHGGGPLPILGDMSHKSMVTFLQELSGTIDKPSAIIVFSAHWEENMPMLQISLIKDLSPKEHIDLGKIIGGLQGRNILIIQKILERIN